MELIIEGLDVLRRLVRALGRSHARNRVAGGTLIALLLFFYRRGGFGYVAGCCVRSARVLARVDQLLAGNEVVRRTVRLLTPRVGRAWKHKPRSALRGGLGDRKQLRLRQLRLAVESRYSSASAYGSLSSRRRSAVGSSVPSAA